MVKCAAKNCTNRSSQKTKSQIKLEAGGKITFHRFPKNDQIRRIWLNNLNLTESSLQGTPFLCSIHFDEDAFDRTSVNRIQLRPGSIPKIPKISFPEWSISTNLEPDADVEIKNEDKAILWPEKIFLQELPAYSMKVENKAELSPKRICIKEELTEALIKEDAQIISSEEFHIASTSSHTGLNVNRTQTSIDLKSRLTSVSPDYLHLSRRPQYVDKATSVSPRLHFNSSSKCQLRTMLRKQSQAHSREVKLLKQKCQRSEKKIALLQNVLSKLRKKKFATRSRY